MTDLDELFGTPSTDDAQSSGATEAASAEGQQGEWIPPWEAESVASPDDPAAEEPVPAQSSGATGAASADNEPVVTSQRRVSFVGFDDTPTPEGPPTDPAIIVDELPPGETEAGDDPYAFLDDDEAERDAAEARLKRRKKLGRVALLVGGLLVALIVIGLIVRGLVIHLPAVLGREEPAVETIVPPDDSALRPPVNKPEPTPTMEVLEEISGVPVTTREPHLLRVTGDATYGGSRPYKISYQISAVRSNQDGVTVDLDCDACLWTEKPQPVTLSEGGAHTVYAVLVPPDPVQFTLRANGEVCIVWTVRHSPTISGYEATCVPSVP